MAQLVIYFIKKDVMTKLISFAISNMNMSLMTFKSDTNHKAGTNIKDGTNLSLKVCINFIAGTSV